jgi:hypothetical protein
VTIVIECRDCGRLISISVESEDFYDWREGLSVQNAFPYLGASDREMFISQTCSECWDDMFKFDMWEDEIASR